MLTIVDNSTLVSVAQCDTQAVVKYHLGLGVTKAKAEDAPKLAGKAVHAGIAHYLRGGTVEEALRVIEVMYRPFADANVPQKDRRMQWSNVRNCALSWFNQFPMEALPFEPVVELIEVPFSVEIAPDFFLTGLFDGIVRDKLSGRYYVLETKTTGQRAEWWDAQWRLASQLSHYTFCAMRAKVVQIHLGQIEVAGVYLNKVDLQVIPSDPKKMCKGNNGHGVPFSECGLLHAQHMIKPYKRTESDLQHWWFTVSGLVKRWKLLRLSVSSVQDIGLVGQQGFFNGSCKFCDLADWCATGRANMFMLREEKWAPIQPSAIS